MRNNWLEYERERRGKKLRCASIIGFIHVTNYKERSVELFGPTDQQISFDLFQFEKKTHSFAGSLVLTWHLLIIPVWKKNSNSVITRFFCCWMFWLIIDSPDIQIIKFLRGFVLELRVKDCQSNVINNIKFITYMLTWLKSEMWSVCYLYEFALFGILYLSTRRHKKTVALKNTHLLMSYWKRGLCARSYIQISTS